MSPLRNKEPKTCVLCGISFTYRGYGKYFDFCSIEHRNMGRARCLQCDKELIQNEKARQDFCSPQCNQQYNWTRLGIPISPSFLAEYTRSTCKCGCGKPITQPKQGGRQFYNEKHKYAYHKAERRGQDSRQYWGGFAPQVRRALLDVEQFMGVTAATRMALAIADEYYPRKKDRGGQFLTCHCKTCRQVFHRWSHGHRSKEYCDKCLKRGKNRRETHTSVKLTQEQVDEIRLLYVTEHLTYQALAEKYDVAKVTIRDIVYYYSWMPDEDDLARQMQKEQVQAEMSARRLGKKWGATRMNQEKAEKMRELWVTGLYTYRALGEVFNVSEATIRNVIKGYYWKPENDSRGIAQ